MSELLDSYAEVVGQPIIDQLIQLGRRLGRIKVVHVNSTKVGGGVAEILVKLAPLMRELGLEVDWEIISGEDQFYQATKGFHNALQGERVDFPPSLIEAYEEANRRFAEEKGDELAEADIVFIHDPQPAPALSLIPRRRGNWIWRCHIDLSRPYRPVWKYVRKYLNDYDASIFSLSDFAQELPCPQYLVPPSIDPLSEKNMDLDQAEVTSVLAENGIDPDRQMMLQVSRFDRFKDPLGVISAYRLVRRYLPDLQLVLAGGGATDDPEGAAVLAEVEAFADADPDIKILLLPSDAHRTINALQRGADIVLQKSIREGFGLTVTEAMWKGKPVIGGDTGGIRLQVIHHHTGYLVNTPEGAALRSRYLLERPGKMADMGAKAKEFVRENFLITRQLREYLTVMVALREGLFDRVELG